MCYWLSDIMAFLKKIGIDIFSFGETCVLIKFVCFLGSTFNLSTAFHLKALLADCRTDFA